MHVHDCILEKTGGPTVNEGLLSYYLANGAVSITLVDAEREFLATKVVEQGTNQDMWMAYWDTLAPPVDTYGDRWQWFWCTHIP